MPRRSLRRKNSLVDARTLADDGFARATQQYGSHTLCNRTRVTLDPAEAARREKCRPSWEAAPRPGRRQST